MVGSVLGTPGRGEKQPVSPGCAAFLRTRPGRAWSPTASSRPAFPAAPSSSRTCGSHVAWQPPGKSQFWYLSSILKRAISPGLPHGQAGPGLHNGCPVTTCSAALAIQVIRGGRGAQREGRQARRWHFLSLPGLRARQDDTRLLSSVSGAALSPGLCLLTWPRWLHFPHEPDYPRRPLLQYQPPPSSLSRLISTVLEGTWPESPERNCTKTWMRSISQLHPELRKELAKPVSVSYVG